MNWFRHNYARRFLTAALHTIHEPRRTITHVWVAHDDWCEKLKGGYCNCDPDIVFAPEGDTKSPDL